MQNKLTLESHWIGIPPSYTVIRYRQSNYEYFSSPTKHGGIKILWPMMHRHELFREEVQMTKQLILPKSETAANKTSSGYHNSTGFEFLSWNNIFCYSKSVCQKAKSCWRFYKTCIIKIGMVVSWNYSPCKNECQQLKETSRNRKSSQSNL